MPLRSEAPKGLVDGLRTKLEAFAVEHGLVIVEKNAWKIEWMAQHHGKCFCDWQHRECPCDFLFQDLARFNGNCLCGVLATPEKAELMAKAQSVKVKMPEEKQAYKATMKKKQKESEKLFAKLFKKGKKAG